MNGIKRMCYEKPMFRKCERSGVAYVARTHVDAVDQFDNALETCKKWRVTQTCLYWQKAVLEKSINYWAFRLTAFSAVKAIYSEAFQTGKRIFRLELTTSSLPVAIELVSSFPVVTRSFSG